MASNLQLERPLSTTAQAVKDQAGHTSSLALSTGNVGIGTTVPAAKLHVTGAQEGALDRTELRVQGPGTGNANLAYVSFVDSAGTNIGYVGDASLGDVNVFLASDHGDVCLYTAAGRILTTTSTGNVGIGTTTPSAKLNVDPKGPGGIVVGDPDTGSGGFTSLLMDISDAKDGFGRIQAIKSSGSAWGDVALNPLGGNVGLGGATNPLRTLQIGPSIDAAFTVEPADVSPNAGYIRFGDQTGWKLHFGRSRESSALHGTPLNTGTSGVLMTIQDNGNVGIGTADPQEKLEVDGNIRATGDVILPGADCAEDFDVEDAQALERGTVVVIGQDGRLQQSKEPYDTRVAGVLSGAGDYRPGIVLGKGQSRKNRLPLALAGKVFCKVDAQYSPIGIGDLLTTSPTVGHAMKANDSFRAFGAIIGKALRPLAEGQSLIPILITLG
jgi:hypothetical protein